MATIFSNPWREAVALSLRARAMTIAGRFQALRVMETQHRGDWPLTPISWITWTEIHADKDCSLKTLVALSVPVIRRVVDQNLIVEHCAGSPSIQINSIYHAMGN